MEVLDLAFVKSKYAEKLGQRKLDNNTTDEKVIDNLSDLIDKLAESEAAEGIFYLCQEPESEAAKAMFCIYCRDFLNEQDEEFIISVQELLQNSKLILSLVEKIKINNLNYSNSQNTVQVGIGNIDINSNSNSTLQIGHGNISIGKCRDASISIKKIRKSD